MLTRCKKCTFLASVPSEAAIDEKQFKVRIGLCNALKCNRKLSYRKDDQAIRPIWVPPKLSRVSEYAHGYLSRNF